MKLPLLPAARLLSAAGLCLATASADSVVFEIGAFDNGNADFEQETDAYNNAQYYSEPGDYSATVGGSGMGMEFTGPGAEILQDGATAADWLLSNEGFPRAVVPGRPVLDVFFQLTAAEAASNALLFETKLFGLGANSSHDVAFYLNNVAISRILRVRGETPVKLYIPANIPGMAFHEGPNVLTIRRTGGGPVVAGGGDNPWIQFDALKLTANVTSPTELLWQVGTFDGNQADFEQERDDYNNPQFYAMAGDYSALAGAAGPGGNFAGPDAEIWKDPEDLGNGSPDGFPRAVVPGRPAIDIYFKLTPAQAQKNFLALHTILFGQGANSSHDVRAYLNGTPVAIGTGIVQDLQVDVLIPRLSAASQGFGPAFHAGNNVLSLVRTGGGPVDPDAGDNPWIQFDAVSLTTAETPATTSDLQAFRTVFSAGYFNSGANEFEQESGTYNNPQFYFAPGDYSGTEGGAGLGQVWDGPGGEIWQDGADSATWNSTQDGFPRALIKADWGRPVIDLFFQNSEAANAKAYLFTTKLFGLGPDSSHDLEFSINGTPFHTGTAIAKDTYVAAMISPAAVLPGSNVISLKRTGGLNTDTAWIQFDQVELIAQAAAVSLPVDLPAFRLTGVTRNAAGEVALTWDSVAGGIYRVQASATMAVNSWADVSPAAITASGTTSTYTDTTIPAGTKVRFYRVVRTQ
ncbi:MAG: hypothetical protein V4726_13570 [Verrucomicrobiota bacterium]